MLLSFADRDREGFVQSVNADGVIIFIRGIGFVVLEEGGRMKKSKAPVKRKPTKLGTINKPKSKKKGKK
jgi:hypothetical protein